MTMENGGTGMYYGSYLEHDGYNNFVNSVERLLRRDNEFVISEKNGIVIRVEERREKSPVVLTYRAGLYRKGLLRDTKLSDLSLSVFAGKKYGVVVLGDIGDREVFERFLAYFVYSEIARPAVIDIEAVKKLLEKTGLGKVGLIIPDPNVDVNGSAYGYDTICIFSCSFFQASSSHFMSRDEATALAFARSIVTFEDYIVNRSFAL